MNEEDKKNLIGKCNLTFDEDEGHYITDGIMTEVSDTLQDVVILNNIDGKVVLCFTACELTNTFTGKMTAVYRQQIWENGCFTHVLNRIPLSNELVNAEHFYELVARRRYNTFGFVRYRKIAIAANGVANENLHYVFPIPRSVILSDKPLSHGDDQIFYYDGNRVNITQQKDKINMWTENYGQRIATDTLTELSTTDNLHFYVQTDILELFKCRYYNRFNLVRMNKIMIGNSAQNLKEVHLFLICPSNNDTLTTSHVPIEEMKECPEMSEAQIQATRNAAIAGANAEFVRDELGGDNEAERQIQIQEQGVQRRLLRQMQLQERQAQAVAEQRQRANVRQQMEQQTQRLAALRQQLGHVQEEPQRRQLLMQIAQLQIQIFEEDEKMYERQRMGAPIEAGRRIIQGMGYYVEYYALKDVEDVALPARIQDMPPSNQEIVRDYMRLNNAPRGRDNNIQINKNISDILCHYMRGYSKQRVLGNYIGVMSNMSIHTVERLNVIDAMLQRLLDNPIPNFIKAIAEASVTGDERLRNIRNRLRSAINYSLLSLPPVRTVEEIQPELVEVMAKLYEYNAIFNNVHKYLLHQNDMREYTRLLIQDTLDEWQRRLEEEMQQFMQVMRLEIDRDQQERGYAVAR